MLYNNVWLIGLGNMGYEYSRVLGLTWNYLYSHRKSENPQPYLLKTGHNAHPGGIEYSCNKTATARCCHNLRQFRKSQGYRCSIINYGVRHILSTRVHHFHEIEELATWQEVRCQNVIAYNRRFMHQ